MKRISVLISAILIGLIHLSCVTTGVNPVEDISPSAGDGNAVADSTGSSGENDSLQQESNTDETGIIYSSRALTDGPLILGSTEYMTGPVMEYSLLYTIYFPLSGIEPPLSHYEPGTGTRWQVESDELDGTVFFERALLSSDDELKSWWLFKVEGNGFERVYEFLIDSRWRLLEMRYLDKNSNVKTYVPSVDEESDLLGVPVVLEVLSSETVKLETAVGRGNAEHYTGDNAEYWVDDSITGNRIRTLLKREGEFLLQADLIEIKKGYESILGSY